MPTEVYLVKVGMSMTEGIVEEWYIPDGSQVSTGELLYRLETEKVNLDVDAETSGTLRHVVDAGVTLEPGDVVGYIYEAGEEIPDKLPNGPSSAHPGPVTAETVDPAGSAAPTGVDNLSAPDIAGGGHLRVSPIARRLAAQMGINLHRLTGTGPNGRIVEADVTATDSAESAEISGPAETSGPRRSSPMARKAARELGINLDTVTGTGPGGRITREDVEAAAASGPAPIAVNPVPTARVQPFKGMRRTIATRMHESLQSMAQLTMDMDVIMDDAVKRSFQDRGYQAELGDQKKGHRSLRIRGLVPKLCFCLVPKRN